MGCLTRVGLACRCIGLYARFVRELVFLGGQCMNALNEGGWGKAKHQVGGLPC